MPLCTWGPPGTQVSSLKHSFHAKQSSNLNTITSGTPNTTCPHPCTACRRPQLRHSPACASCCLVTGPINWCNNKRNWLDEWRSLVTQTIRNWIRVYKAVLFIFAEHSQVLGCLNFANKWTILHNSNMVYDLSVLRASLGVNFQQLETKDGGGLGSCINRQARCVVYTTWRMLVQQSQGA